MAAQRTPLHNVAVGQGATFQDWYDWELPWTYVDVVAEYKAAVEGAGLHDSSYAGRLRATGSDVLDLLNRLSTNEVISLQPGEGAATVLTTDRGRVLDLLTVLNLGDHVLLITSPRTRDKVIEWIDKYTIVDDVALEDVTLSTAMLSVVGPKAQALLESLSGLELDTFAPYQSAQVTIGRVEAYLVRRDLVSLPRFELIVHREDAEAIWERMVDFGAQPVGLEAYEVLRVERVAPGYEKELGESYNPLETGLWGSISFTKGCYIGQEVIARLDTYQKVQRHLVFLGFSRDAQVEEGARLTADSREVGHVTSVARVPTTGKLIGLAYVRREAAEVGTQLSLAETEGGWAEVEGQALPFGPSEAT